MKGEGMVPVRYGRHLDHCSTVVQSGHLICDCGWAYYLAHAADVATVVDADLVPPSATLEAWLRTAIGHAQEYGAAYVGCHVDMLKLVRERLGVVTVAED